MNPTQTAKILRCIGEAGAEAVRVYRPGDVNVLATTDRHRIELLEADCWTLFLAGPFAREWQFDREC